MPGQNIHLLIDIGTIYFANFFIAQCCYLWEFDLHEECLENFCSLLSFYEALLTSEHVFSSHILLNFLDGTSYANKNATIYCTWDKVLFGLARKKSLLSILLVSTMRGKEKINQVANWMILAFVIHLIMCGSLERSHPDQN